MNAALLERLGAIETQVHSLERKGNQLSGQQVPSALSLLQRVEQMETEMAEVCRRLKRQHNHDGRCRALLVKFEDRLQSLEGLEPGSHHLASLDLMDDYDLNEEYEPEQGAGAMLLEGSGYEHL